LGHGFVVGTHLFSLVRGQRRPANWDGFPLLQDACHEPRVQHNHNRHIFRPEYIWASRTIGILVDERTRERGSQTRCFRETPHPKSRMGVVLGNVAVEKPTHLPRVWHDDCVACDPCPPCLSAWWMTRRVVSFGGGIPFTWQIDEGEKKDTACPAENMHDEWAIRLFERLWFP
jgi:hypothetical protein